MTSRCIRCLIAQNWWTITLSGVSFFMRLLGPAAGYALASLCLKTYISPDLTPVINNKDPQWLGAWWIGKKRFESEFIDNIFFFQAGLFSPRFFSSFRLPSPCFLKNCRDRRCVSALRRRRLNEAWKKLKEMSKRKKQKHRLATWLWPSRDFLITRSWCWWTLAQFYIFLG